MGRNGQSKTSEQLQLSFASPFLTIDQVAALIGVPKSFIYRRTARGHGDPIPHYRLGGHLRFHLDDIEAWIEAHRSEEPAKPAQMAATRRRSAATTRERLVRRTPPS